MHTKTGNPDVTFIGNATLVLVIAVFLSAATTLATNGFVALFLFLAAAASFLMHICECTKKCRTRRAIRRQICLYLFGLATIGAYAVAVNAWATIYLALFWIAGLVFLAVWRWIGPVGENLHKPVDGVLNSGIIAG